MPATSGVLGNDSEVDGTLTAVLVAGPSHGTLVFNADGSFTYQTAADFNGGDSFSYRATDGTADSNPASVSITIRAVNDAPVASSRSMTTEIRLPISISLVAQDVDADTLSYRIVSGRATARWSGGGPQPPVHAQEEVLRRRQLPSSPVTASPTAT